MIRNLSALLLLFPWTCLAAEQETLDPTDAASARQSPLATIEPADGDTFIFLGDSISYECIWTQYVEDYFYTRFPDKKIRFINGAVGGDRSWWLADRFDLVVAPYKPQYATIMLGMNDGRYQQYSPELYRRYQESMTDVINRLDKLGTKTILMSPPHFDRRTRITVRPHPNVNYNGVLSLYGSWLREKAMNEGHGFVDVNSAMGNLIVQQRKLRPDFTLTTDGIHSRELGQMVMAVALLEQMDMPNIVSTVEVSIQEVSQPKASNAQLSDLQRTETSVQFTLQANSLPWVVPETARAGYDLIHASESLNRETVCIRGLKDGSYEMKIDGQTVGVYDHLEWAIGVSLQDNPKTPQWRQAAHVAELNSKRNEHMQLYSKVWMLWAGRLHERAWLAEHKPGDIFPGDRPYEKIQDVVKSVEDGLKLAPEALQKAEAITPEIYAAAQPKPRRYEITRVE